MNIIVNLILFTATFVVCICMQNGSNGMNKTRKIASRYTIRILFNNLSKRDQDDLFNMIGHADKTTHFDSLPNDEAIGNLARAYKEKFSSELDTPTWNRIIEKDIEKALNLFQSSSHTVTEHPKEVMPSDAQSARNGKEQKSHVLESPEGIKLTTGITQSESNLQKLHILEPSKGKEHPAAGRTQSDIVNQHKFHILEPSGGKKHPTRRTQSDTSILQKSQLHAHDKVHAHAPSTENNQPTNISQKKDIDNIEDSNDKELKSHALVPHVTSKIEDSHSSTSDQGHKGQGHVESGTAGDHAKAHAAGWGGWAKSLAGSLHHYVAEKALDFVRDKEKDSKKALN